MLKNFSKYVKHITLVKVDKINIYDIDDISEINQTRRRFDSGRLHQETMSRETLGFREIWNGPSFLNRSAVSRRMHERDNIGKNPKKTKKKSHEHYRKDWDKDLWD